MATNCITTLFMTCFIHSTGAAHFRRGSQQRLRTKMQPDRGPPALGARSVLTDDPARSRLALGSLVHDGLSDKTLGLAARPHGHPWRAMRAVRCLAIGTRYRPVRCLRVPATPACRGARSQQRRNSHMLHASRVGAGRKMAGAEDRARASPARYTARRLGQGCHPRDSDRCLDNLAPTSVGRESARTDPVLVAGRLYRWRRLWRYAGECFDREDGVPAGYAGACYLLPCAAGARLITQAAGTAQVLTSPMPLFVDGFMFARTVVQ